MKRFYGNFRKTQITVGIFTFIILAMLVLGYLWLTNRVSMHSQQDLRISFQDVMGLEVGDKTMFRGMEVGRVKKIQARDTDILVSSKINSGIRLKEGAVFYVGDSSLMGGTALNIRQGEGPGFLDLRKTMTGSVPLGIMSILPQARTALDEMNALLAEIRGEQGLVDKSEALLDDAGQAARSLDQAAERLSQDVNSTLARVDRLTAGLEQIVNSNATNLNDMITGAPPALDNINSTMDSLRALSGRLGETARALNSGQGSAGKLLQDKELYDRLVRSVAGLDSLITDIKSNPKKYVKFSLF